VSAVCRNTDAERFDVRLRFSAAAEAAHYLRALTSLFFGASTKVRTTLTTGAPREDLTAEEIADRLARADINKLRFEIRLGAQAIAVELAFLGSEPGAVAIRTPFTSGPATTRLWLQSDVDVVAPIPALALPTTADALALDAAQAFVGLALRCGGFVEAELTCDQPLSWNTTKPSDAAQPVRSTLRDGVWSTATSEGAVALWVTGLPPPQKPRTPEPGWWEQYDLLARSPREALNELHAHLAAHFDIPFAWAVVDKTAAPEDTFVVPPEASAIARLVPEADRVVVAVDLEQPASLVAEILLHLCAHLTLGHVRPRDAWGHWDTPASLSLTPHRQWDREARDVVDAHFARPVRRVSSLEECNPREKAWLVLLDHIGRMVGQQCTPRRSVTRPPPISDRRRSASWPSSRTTVARCSATASVSGRPTSPPPSPFTTRTSGGTGSPSRCARQPTTRSASRCFRPTRW